MGRQATQPRTVVGRWLSAGVLDDADARTCLGHQLNGGVRGWNDDEPAVVEAACEIAVRKYFGPDPAPEAIAAFVSELHRRVKDSRSPLERHSAEAVVWWALGKRDCEIDGLKRVALFNARGLTAVQICIWLQLDSSDVEELISDAEVIAFERGWNPPLAT
jgi:hypothetical protein